MSIASTSTRDPIRWIALWTRHGGRLPWTLPANVRITRWRMCTSSDTNSTHSSPRPNVPSPSIPTMRSSWRSLGISLHYAGDERGIALVRKAMKLDPFHPTWFYFPIAHYHFDRGEYEEALAAATKDRYSRLLLDLRSYLAAIYAELGRQSEARSAVEELLRLYPGSNTETLIEELRKYNYPEDSIRRNPSTTLRHPSSRFTEQFLLSSG